jgi:hypothetical protein
MGMGQEQGVDKKKLNVSFGFDLDIKEVDDFLVEFFCKNSNIGRCYPFTFYW